MKKASRRCTVQHFLHYEGMGGCQISRQKRYVTLEWPLTEITAMVTLSGENRENSGGDTVRR